MHLIVTLSASLILLDSNDRQPGTSCIKFGQVNFELSQPNCSPIIEAFAYVNSMYKL